MHKFIARVGMTLPRGWRHWLQRYIDLTEVKQAYWSSLSSYETITESSDNRYGSPCRVGIIRNQWHRHLPYVIACVEMGVPFVVLDLASVDWMERIKSADCGLLLVWPDANSIPWSGMVKDRVFILESLLGLQVIPSSHELWMYEDKLRTHYWLKGSGIPHPTTWVFYRKSDAMQFIDQCPMPIVFKMSMASSSLGVKIVRDRRHLKSLVKVSFGRGHVAPGQNFRDAQRGYIMFQEWLEDVREWRMVRIGDSYFGHPKGKVGSFHSGSGVVEWDVPMPQHLNFLHKVTEAGGFFSMAVDVFETPGGRLLVNELQTVFGAKVSIDQLRINGVAGRMVRAAGGDWSFEAGDFARNACANERLRQGLRRLESGTTSSAR